MPCQWLKVLCNWAWVCVCRRLGNHLGPKWKKWSLQCQACGPKDVPLILNSTALIPDLHDLSISNVQISDPVNGLAAPGIRFWCAAAVLLILLLIIALSTAHSWLSARVQDRWFHFFWGSAAENGPGGVSQKAVENLSSSLLAVWPQWYFDQTRGSATVGPSKKTPTSGFLPWSMPRSKPTDCLNGLRVLAMAWIILGHSFLMPEGAKLCCLVGKLGVQDVLLQSCRCVRLLKSTRHYNQPAPECLVNSRSSQWVAVWGPLNKAAAESNPLLMIIIQAEQSLRPRRCSKKQQLSNAEKFQVWTPSFSCRCLKTATAPARLGQSVVDVTGRDSYYRTWCWKNFNIEGHTPCWPFCCGAPCWFCVTTWNPNGLINGRYFRLTPSLALAMCLGNWSGGLLQQNLGSSFGFPGKAANKKIKVVMVVYTFGRHITYIHTPICTQTGTRIFSCVCAVHDWIVRVSGQGNIFSDRWDGIFQVGVLWSSAIFGLWTLRGQVTRLHFPALWWVMVVRVDLHNDAASEWCLDMPPLWCLNCSKLTELQELYPVWFWQNLYGLDLVFGKLGRNPGPKICETCHVANADFAHRWSFRRWYDFLPAWKWCSVAERVFNSFDMCVLMCAEHLKLRLWYPSTTGRNSWAGGCCCHLASTIFCQQKHN